MKDRNDVCGQFVVARGDTSEMLDASEESFNEIVIAVEMVIEVALN